VKRVIVLASVLLGGCAAKYTFTNTGAVAPAPKPAGCAFEIMDTEPSWPHEQIGVLEYSFQTARSLGEFKAAISEQMCSVGGDAVVPVVVGAANNYTRGIVFRRTGG
jgi:hypothetical protein